MTFEDLKALLSTATGIEAEKVLEGVQDLIADEKSRGIALYQKKDGELLKLKATLKEAGYDSTKHETLKDYVRTLSERASTSDSAQLTINTLNEKLVDLESKFAESARTRIEAESRANKESLRSKLTAALGEKVYGSKYVIESLLEKGEVKKVEGKEVWAVDGVDLEFGVGLEKFLKGNTDILKSTKTQGTGVPGSTASENKNYSELTVEEATARVKELGKEYGVNI